MARYRQKDQADLEWNEVRRRITRELDSQIARWREHQLNTLLSSAWTRFAASLDKGEVLSMESHYEGWVAKALDGAITIVPEEPSASLDSK